MHFRKSRARATNFEFTIGSNKLETVYNYKYLGITFTYSGNFIENGERQLKQGDVLLGRLFPQYIIIKTLGLTHTRNYFTLVSFQFWTIHPVSGGSKNFNRSIIFKIELFVIFLEFIVLRQLCQFMETLDGYLVNIDV